MTAQAPDIIEIDGGEHHLLATPLDQLLGSLGDVVPPLVAPTTANWRGYVARWRVAENRLFLEDVRGWVDDGAEAGPGVVLPGVVLPVAATWVSGALRVGSGAVVRHVHAEFESRYERELLLDVSEGIVTGRRELAIVGAMGMAGPYRLDEPLLGMLSGGGFGQLIAASDLDGRPLVAKAARPSGGAGGTEMWMDTPNGRRPVHVPAKAFHFRGDGWEVQAVDGAITAAVLTAEAGILERDGGVLLPASLGLWEHDPSGAPVLVMERLEGKPPQDVHDVREVLAAVADAVDRGTFEAHGDLKHEHVFVQPGLPVRVCDPAPRFENPTWHAYTAAYNPRGWPGPAADVVACAAMVSYLADAPPSAREWARELLEADRPPEWALGHRAALGRLDAFLARG